MKLGAGDYQKAHRYHWLHANATTPANILDSELPALESQIFYDYWTNGIEVGAAKQRRWNSGGSPVWMTMSSIAYGSSAPAHRPSSMTDGAGQTTSYTYTSTGQVATITNPKSEVTTFTTGRTRRARRSDVWSRSRATWPAAIACSPTTVTAAFLNSTDSEGYVLTYGYDSLDRVRTITYPESSLQFEYKDHSTVASRDREGRWTRHMNNIR